MQSNVSRACLVFALFGAVLLGSSCFTITNTKCGEACDYLDQCNFGDPPDPAFCDSDCKTARETNCASFILGRDCDTLETFPLPEDCSPVDGGTPGP